MGAPGSPATAWQGDLKVKADIVLKVVDTV